MSNTSNHGFGPLLRAHRERRGITLDALAESIKVNASLLAKLERNDVTRWPPGIYGRALVREYAKSIGLPADDVVRQFLELLSPPAERRDVQLSGQDVGGADATVDLRLTFADASAHTRARTEHRLVGAGGELTFVLVTGCLVALATGLQVWTAIAIVALLWVLATAVLCGHEALYRIPRVDRLSAFLSRSRTTPISRARTSLVSIGKTVVTSSVGSVSDSLIVESDVQADASSPASVH
jgi:transcriptional regulator with XRE-family HTH domain